MNNHQKKDHRSRIEAVIRHASKIVATWPKWKQNILVNSAKPMLDTPRKPCVPSDDE